MQISIWLHHKNIRINDIDEEQIKKDPIKDDYDHAQARIIIDEETFKSDKGSSNIDDYEKID